MAFVGLASGAPCEPRPATAAEGSSLLLVEPIFGHLPRAEFTNSTGILLRVVMEP